MSEPLDLDALAHEATREPFRFVFDAETYELSGRLDVRVAAALEGNRLDEALQRLLGPEQWDRLNASPQIFDPEMLWAVLDAYTKHLGTELGNSSASTASSSPIRERSRPTSSATTTSSLAG